MGISIMFFPWENIKVFFVFIRYYKWEARVQHMGARGIGGFDPKMAADPPAGGVPFKAPVKPRALPERFMPWLPQEPGFIEIGKQSLPVGLEKGKPLEREGRKATGLSPWG
jgi:hypothetical protein